MFVFATVSEEVQSCWDVSITVEDEMQRELQCGPLPIEQKALNTRL